MQGLIYGKIPTAQVKMLKEGIEDFDELLKVKGTSQNVELLAKAELKDKIKLEVSRSQKIEK